MTEEELQKLRDHNLNVYKELGFFALKTLLTINGGAVIVILAFLGNLIGADATNGHVSIPLMKASIVAFVFGLVFCFLAAVANMLLALDYVRSRENNQNERAYVLITFLTVFPIVSLSYFAIGVCVALKAIR